MDVYTPPKEVDFHFDVMCPWAYQTSLWMRDVRDQLDLKVNWKFFSLEEINLKEGKKHPWEREWSYGCLLYTSPSPRDATLSRMPSSA